MAHTRPSFESSNISFYSWFVSQLCCWFFWLLKSKIHLTNDGVLIRRYAGGSCTIDLLISSANF
ncbi:hypothetical protein B0H12DRAFT_1106822 [Mycena haematopus]|nr:hypothetical protein B0H12DRAFT_1106822 [Mycena haematopus]